MALPTQKFTWNYQHTVIETSDPEIPALQNYANVAVYDSQIRLLIYRLKQLLTHVSGGWSCVQSCGYRSDTPGWYADANDNWDAPEAVRFNEGGSQYSWMVLQNDNIKTGFQLLLSCHYSAAETQSFQLWFSHSGSFTGGTTSARPTAPDEYYVDSGSNLVDGTSFRRTVHVLTSTVGTNTRIIIGEDQEVRDIVVIERFDDSNRAPNPPNDGEAITGVICVNQNTTIVDPSGEDHGCVVNGVRGSWHGAMEGVQYVPAPKSSFLRGPDPSGNYYITPIYCLGWGALCNCFLGMFDDIYGISTALPIRTYIPSSATPTWVAIDGVMFPTGGNLLDV